MSRTAAVLASSLFTCTLAAQNLMLPDFAHLCESPTQDGAPGSASFWVPSGFTAAGWRFQVLYEASHFTGKAGVAGPITLQHLRFRGEDGEANTGGQVYSGITVTVCKTTHTNATMSTSWTDNLPPGVGGTTSLLGTVVVPSLVVGASAGTTPNTEIIDLDLTGATIVFDPLTDPLGQVNLLVDVTYTGYSPAPPIPPQAVFVPTIAISDSQLLYSDIRGKALSGLGTSATGTFTRPPRLRVEFSGGGGYASLDPARTEWIGASCSGAAPSTASFYQSFTNSNAFDLAGSGLLLTPDNPAAPTYYTVTSGAGPFDPTRVNPVPNATGGDDIVGFSLGYTFEFPGGSTTTIRPSVNGFVWLDPTAGGPQYSPSIDEFLGVTFLDPRFAVFWHDFHAGRNTLTNPSAGLHVQNDTSGGPGNTVTYVTWLDIGEFTTVDRVGQSSSNMQLVIREATNAVEFRYGTMGACNAMWIGSWNGITGFSRGYAGGAAAKDPGSRDLSHEVPFTTGSEVASHPHISATSSPVAASASYGARMFGGQTLTFRVSNVPAGTVLMLVNLDIAATQPGFNLPGLVAPGCMISTGVSPLLLGFEIAVLPGPTFTGTVPLVVPHVDWGGAVITAQAMELDFGGPNLVKWASDTMKFRVGLR